MPVLRKCCCCFPLRRGTVTLGVMGFTGSITAIISLALGFIFVESIATLVIDGMAQIIDIPRATGTRHLPKEDQDKEVQKLHDFLVYTYSNIIFVAAIIGTIIGGILAGLMVWGAVKSRRNYLLPWLIFETIIIIGTAICIITSMILLPVSYAIAVLIIGLIELLIMVYFWLVVFSFFQELRDRERMEINAPAEMKTRLTSHF